MQLSAEGRYWIADLGLKLRDRGDLLLPDGYEDEQGDDRHHESDITDLHLRQSADDRAHRKGYERKSDALCLVRKRRRLRCVMGGPNPAASRTPMTQRRRRRLRTRHSASDLRSYPLRWARSS